LPPNATAGHKLAGGHCEGRAAVGQGDARQLAGFGLGLQQGQIGLHVCGGIRHCYGDSRMTGQHTGRIGNTDLCDDKIKGFGGNGFYDNGIIAVLTGREG